MTKKVYRVWSEWDFGYDQVVFASEELALADIENDHNVIECAEDSGCSPSDFVADGLMGVKAITLIE